MKYVENGKYTSHILQDIGMSIWQTTNKSDAIDVSLIHAYITRSQYEVAVEEKYKRYDRNKGTKECMNHCN